MKIFILFLSLCFSQTLSLIEIRTVWNPTKYPIMPEIKFGVSSSAYQIEGAWNQDGKGESIWDRYLHTHPEAFAPGPNGDEACDSYNNLDRDIEMLRQLGSNYYRFSISWSRVMPTGFPNHVNIKALEYYQKLTENLHKHRIEAMAVMYYNDLPQPLQDLGGWTNPKITDWFTEYARLLFTTLPYVTYWIPINDPSVCFDMYGGGKMAPAIDSKGVGDYKCVKNMLMAHAKTYRLFKKEFHEVINNKSMQLVGFSLNVKWFEPLFFNESTTYQKALDIIRDFTVNLYLDPIYSERGDFPQVVKDTVAHYSKKEGLEESRLPKLSAAEIKMLRNSTDFFGLNYYTAYNIRKPKPGWKKSIDLHLPIDLEKKVNVDIFQSDRFMKSKTAPEISLVAWGLYRICMYLNKRYKKPAIILTEAGWPSGPGLNDTDRVFAMFELFKSLAMTLHDGSDLRGFTVYSLMDSIEWTAGSIPRYGLFEVDFDSPAKTRSPRLSAHYLRNLIDNRLVIENFTLPSDDFSLSISPRTAPRKPRVS